MPPRTTSKPLISVTAQSSTESTQDAYQDGRAQRMAPWPQDGRGLYNSTDSLDSTKAMSLALETAAAQRLGSDGQSGPLRSSDRTTLGAKAEDFVRGPRSSVGIQVASLSAAGAQQGLRPPREGRQAGLRLCCQPAGAADGGRPRAALVPGPCLPLPPAGPLPSPGHCPRAAGNSAWERAALTRSKGDFLLTLTSPDRGAGGAGTREEDRTGCSASLHWAEPQAAPRGVGCDHKGHVRGLRPPRAHTPARDADPAVSPGL